MGKQSKKDSLTLIGLDIEGEWNFPLLRNAADISGAALKLIETPVNLNQLQVEYDRIIACEVKRGSKTIFDFPACRGRVALIVGNEKTGIPKKYLGKVDHVVSIPMSESKMSSINVAVAAAIALYIFEKDYARKRTRKCYFKKLNFDLLVCGIEDPNELGSLFRSAWAFGWRHVFLSDDRNAWFTKDRQTILAGRSAARREINPLTVIPAGKIDFDTYNHIFVCNRKENGTPLSRFSIPGKGKALMIYGDDKVAIPGHIKNEHVYVDFCEKNVNPYPRHEGSILLSVISEIMKRGNHG